MTAPTKEETHRQFYEAFHAWFMQSGCDFWSECEAPEELATIAVELSDRLAIEAQPAMLAAIEAAQKWRPIDENTPRDGSEIIIKLGADGVPAYWDEELRTFVLSRPLHLESVRTPREWRLRAALPPAPEETP